jgi:hypothetical protein
MDDAKEHRKNLIRVLGEAKAAWNWLKGLPEDSPVDCTDYADYEGVRGIAELAIKVAAYGANAEVMVKVLEYIKEKLPVKDTEPTLSPIVGVPPGIPGWLRDGPAVESAVNLLEVTRPNWRFVVSVDYGTSPPNMPDIVEAVIDSYAFADTWKKDLEEVSKMANIRISRKEKE